MSDSYKLVISQQPQKLFRFRYKSDGGSHGSLNAEDAINHTLWPEVKLTVPPAPSLAGNSNYGVKVFLSHDIDGEKKPSPHLLKCKKEEKNCVIVSGQMEKDKTNPNVFFFKLENYYIHRTMKNEHKQVLIDQRIEFEKLGVELNTSEEMKCAVHLSFIAYNINNSARVGETCYSHEITQGNEKLLLKKLCNLEGDVNGGLDVNILINRKIMEKNQIQVVLCEDIGDWSSNKFHVKFENAQAISFTLPKYGGKNKNNRIKCKIQLLENGKITNDSTQEFNYTRNQYKRSDFTNNDTDSSPYDPENSNTPATGNPNVERDSSGTNSSIQNRQDMGSNMGVQLPTTGNPNVAKDSPGTDSSIQNGRGSHKGSTRRRQRPSSPKSAKYAEKPKNGRKLHETNNLQKNIERMDSLADIYNKDYKNGNNNGRKILHYVCALDMSEEMRPLINSKKKICSQDNFGRTPLHIAIEKHHDKCIEKFRELLKSELEKYPSFNEDLKKLFASYNMCGRTVLHLAVLNNLEGPLHDMLKFCF